MTTNYYNNTSKARLNLCPTNKFTTLMGSTEQNYFNFRNSFNPTE